MLACGGGAAIIAGVLVIASPAGLSAQDAPKFELPVDCVPGRSCFIQNFVDRDPGPGFKDYMCGSLGYDGSKGTDFRLATYREMAAGVRVLAGAPGTVRAVRDGMADIDVGDTGAQAVKGREAGNGVVVQHGGGWETQYSHLRKGSVRVKPGERVRTGQVLGLVGLSGMTEFPHVEFTVRYQGKTLDPFIGVKAEAGCGVGAVPLWSNKALKQLDYQATGLLDAGFASRALKLKEMERGLDEAASLPVSSPALVFWVYYFGAQRGDEVRLRLLGPKGGVLAQNSHVYKTNKAQASLFAGRKLKSSAWPAGPYRGEFVLLRSVKGTRKSVIAISRTVQLQ